MIPTFRTGIARRVLAAAAVAVMLAFAGPPEPAQRSKSADAASRKLAIFLTSGLEDSETMRLSLVHAKEAKQTGLFSDVVWIASDRGVEALGGARTGAPSGVIEAAREAKAAGVRLVVSEDGLQRERIGGAKLEPVPDEMVRSGMAKVSELIAAGYQVLHY